MSDKELLEAAARAAGLSVRCVRSNDGKSVSFYAEPDNLWWNPLLDDGDALRLAVKLYLHINHFRPHYTSEIAQIPPDNQMYGTVEVQREDDDDPLHTEWYKAGSDVYAATRRAIVRAAAALGGLES